MLQNIIPLEGNPSNKLKETHRQVKCLSEFSILHWNHIHPRPYMHSCFQVISLTVIKILHIIGWFKRRNQNWVILTLAGYCPEIPYPINILLKRDPGPRQHHKIALVLLVVAVHFGCFQIFGICNNRLLIRWIWSLRTSSSQCHNKPVLVPPRKPPDPMKDLYDGQTYNLKTRVDIWTSMDIVPVEYGKFTQTFHLTM